MKLVVGILVMVAAFSVRMPQAEAKGFFLINTGEDVVAVGEIKPELKAELESNTAVGAQIGMMYSRFGLFWLDIWRWDKKYVLFQDVTVWEITEEQAKEFAVGGSLSVPITMTIPPGLMVIIGGILVAILIKVLRKKSGDDAGTGTDEPEPTT